MRSGIETGESNFVAVDLRVVLACGWNNYFSFGRSVIVTLGHRTARSGRKSILVRWRNALLNFLVEFRILILQVRVFLFKGFNFLLVLFIFRFQISDCFFVLLVGLVRLL